MESVSHVILFGYDEYDLNVSYFINASSGVKCENYGLDSKDLELND